MLTNDRSRRDGYSNIFCFVLFISTLHMYQVHLVHTDEQYIYIYIDNKSLLIFSYHHVCFNSVDDDDDETPKKRTQKTSNPLLHKNHTRKKKNQIDTINNMIKCYMTRRKNNKAIDPSKKFTDISMTVLTYIFTKKKNRKGEILL
jgi:UDP-galactopyranose mutase